MSFFIRSKIIINRILKKTYTALQRTLPGPDFGKSWIVFIPYIAAAILAAAVSVFYSQLFHYVETSVLYTAALHPYTMLLLTPLCFYLSWLLVTTFAPAAGGSGIPQVIASLDLVAMEKTSWIERLLSFRMAVVKIISSTVALAGGAAVGREGPTLQISATIFYLTHRYLPASWVKLNLQKMLIAGGSAGLAAAFNTPLGGIVFAIEELTKTHISNIRSSMFIAVIVAGMTAQLFLGPYLYLGYPQVAAFTLSQIPYVLLIAALGGFASGWSCSIILAIFRWKRSLKKIWMNHFFVIGSGIAMALLIVAVGPLAAASGRETLLTLLFPSDVHVEWYLLPARFAGSIISYSAGLAG
ncbi:MAG: chloride channel protein, partial [Bacteroidota bacterium]